MVVHAVTRVKGSKDQAIPGMQRTGRVIPPLSERKVSELSWGETVHLNCPLIPESHLPALTIYVGSLI